MNLILSKKDATEYGRKHQKAMMLIYQATEDYIASRCCLLNGLIVGLVLGAQAVEKYLKGYALIIEPTINVKKLSHNLKELAIEISSLKSNLQLDKYMPLLERLYLHYQSRYPDNKEHVTIKSTSELNDIDELIIDIVISLPIPPEIKYRSNIFPFLFIEDEKSISFSSGMWLKLKNKSISKNIKNFRSDYFAVYKYLYPDVI